MVRHIDTCTSTHSLLEKTFVNNTRFINLFVNTIVCDFIPGTLVHFCRFATNFNFIAYMYGYQILLECTPTDIK